MWGSMMKWFSFLLRCCKRRRRHRVVRVHDPESEHYGSGFQRSHRRTYYYSMFSVRVAIMIMLAVLIALLTILTWHFTTVYTTRSIKTLAYGLRTELLNRPIARMWNLLNSTVEATLSQVQLSQFVLSQYSLPISPAMEVELHKTMRNVTWALFVSRKSAKTFTVAYRNGQLQAYDRSDTSNFTFYLYTNPSNGTALTGENMTSSSPAPAPDAPVTAIPLNTSNVTWFSETVNSSTGIANASPVPTESYDLLTGIEDVQLLRNSEVAWRVSVSNLSDTPVLSSAAPIRHPSTGSTVAIASISTALSSINLFLRELTSSHSGYLYLTTPSGQLLASSTNVSLIDTSTPKRSLVLANETSDPVIRAGAQWLNKHYGFEGLVNRVVHEENVVLQGKRYYIDTFSLVLPRLQMVGVIIIPRSYVMGEVDRRGKATLAILISISGCILLVGCIFIIFFTSGVSTEMKLRAELINHLDARRRAEASSNYKSQFLANMSHELRTPMAAVIGLLDILLCDECLSSEQVNMVSQIRRCSTALLRLLNNILDISKVESGKLLLEMADFDLNQELEGLVDMFSVQCVDHDIEIVLDLSDDMPRMVRGDSARTVQIFANLIANSVKFTSAGHVILRGWCGSPNMSASELRNGLLFGTNDNSWDQSKAGHESLETNSHGPGQFLLWFEVEDTGCGIDSSKWESVFDNFVQADPSTTRTYGGTGLGLCIVRSLVRKMGGDIKIVKKEGPGTLLRFYLMSGQPVVSECETPRFSIPAELGNAKVLLAMKGDVGRCTLVQWMHYRGLHVYEAAEWDETIQVLQELLADHHSGSWENVNNCTEFGAPIGNSRKSSQLIAASRDVKDSPDDEVSLVLSGSPGHWKTQNSKLLAVLDAELIPWSTDSDQLVSFLSVLDGFRDQGIMISWLFTHDTPNSLKTQLRQTGYLISANQPLYTSKLLQLLTSMLVCLERRSSRHSKSDHQALQVIGNSQRNSGYYDDIKAATMDLQELEKIQSQVPSKVGLSVVTKSLPHVLKTWPSTELVSVKSTHPSSPKLSESGLPLDFERSPISRKGSDRLELLNSGPNNNVKSSVLLQQIGEQESINLSNLGPAASPGSSPGSSKCDASIGPTTTVRIADQASVASVSRPVIEGRPSTRNFIVRKSPTTQLGPSNALVGIRILLAEDTPLLAKVATIMLEKLGAQVVAVADGMLAVETIGKSRSDSDMFPTPLTVDKFDLVLMDCQMPRMDGYDATKAIRKAEEGKDWHLPIVALTAHAMSSDEAKCLEVGMDAYLTKPIDTKLMVSTILGLTKKDSS